MGSPIDDPQRASPLDDGSDDNSRSGKGADSALKALRRQLKTRPAPAPAIGGRCRILLADDHADYLATLGELLELHDYEVLCVCDGPAVLAAVEQFQPHAVLLDLRLRGQDGLEAARAIRALRGRVQPYIAAVTAVAARDTRALAAEAGIDSYHLKPIDTRDLLALLEQVASRAGSAPGASRDA